MLIIHYQGNWSVHSVVVYIEYRMLKFNYYISYYLFLKLNYLLKILEQ
jgi:hypothetical protein